MKLSLNNIKFVKEFTEDEMPYHWFVSMKSGNISDSRTYSHYDAAGRTIVKEFKKEDLPKTVQKFIDTHERNLFGTTDEKHSQYIYQVQIIM